MEEEEQPYLIITAGNTGSGKTGLITETLRYLGIQDKPYVKILIDDLVEMDCKYKVRVIQIINRIAAMSQIQGRPEEDYYNNPSEELYNLFKQAYFAVRKGPGCLGTELNCNDLNEKNLDDAVADKKNIVFEFTGQYIPTWLLNLGKIGSSYNVVFSCSVVNLENLFIRNISRASRAVNAFKQDYGKPAPRLPDVSRDQLIQNMLQFRKILNQIYTDCIQSYSEEICGNKRINNLLVFDNNGGGLRLIFDSSFSSQADFEAINSSFGLDNSPRRMKRRSSSQRKKKRSSPQRKKKRSSPQRKRRSSPQRKKN
jgi:hypothetical protein